MMAIAVLLVGLLPPFRIKNRLLGLLQPRWTIDPTARIHSVVLWRVERLSLGPQAYLGPGSVFRQLVRLELAEEAVVGQFNWVTAEARYAEQSSPEAAGSLVLHRGAAVASRHYLDCAGGIEFGAISILAGVRTTILTHWADHHSWVLRAAPVTVGAGTIISAGVSMTAGAAVPDGCVVAAGAVVPKALPDSATLYAGVPAKPVGDLTGAAHARRTTPHFPRPSATPSSAVSRRPHVASGSSATGGERHAL